jgi:hypothetical protein
MKFWRYSLITAICFFTISTTVLYTSCEKDSCADLVCKNGGSCAEGFCRCQTGYEGTQCEIQTATKFLGTFIGNYTCPATTPLVDTVDIWLTQAPNKVNLVEHGHITDTIAGTVNGTELTFAEQTGNNSTKYTRAEMLANKLTVYIEEVINVSTGEKKTCNFIGFK